MLTDIIIIAFRLVEVKLFNFRTDKKEIGTFVLSLSALSF